MPELRFHAKNILGLNTLVYRKPSTDPPCQSFRQTMYSFMPCFYSRINTPEICLLTRSLTYITHTNQNL